MEHNGRTRARFCGIKCARTVWITKHCALDTCNLLVYMFVYPGRRLFGILIVTMVSGIYVDEPLLYDTFPTKFIWAAATASYQIEGGWNADGKK